MKFSVRMTLSLLALCALPLFAPAEGWQPLFNGKDLSGWKTVGSPEWTVQDGVITVNGAGQEMGWLITDKPYSNFVFRARFQWTGGNSGIQALSRMEGEKMIGYQANLDPSRPKATGSLLEENGRGMLQESSLSADQIFKKGEWNDYEVSALGDQITVAVNGQITAEVTDAEGAKEGLLALQMAPGEGAAMKWSDLRILLELPAGSQWVSLFNDKDLSGWKPLADATWNVVDGAIYGKYKDGGYGWLLSEDQYQDFHLSLRFKMKEGNSGIQFRSQIDPKAPNMVQGLQADIDNASDWISGHLYDQNGKGSVAKPTQDFSKLIDWDGWNTYEVTAIGPKVELFINGVKSIEYNEAPLKPGIFAFQIHSGKQMDTSWDDIRIINLDKK